jgi:hypothetical protein
VHSPYDAVPGFDCESSVPPYPGVYAGMLNESDVYVGQLAAELKAKSYWDNTLIIYSSDNVRTGTAHSARRLPPSARARRW